MAKKSVATTKKAYTKNLGKKYPSLTSDVVSYKNCKKDSLIAKIMRDTRGLVCSLITSSGAKYNFTREIIDDIIEDSQTLVLLKAIETYDVTRKAAFSTHYCWKLRSYIDYKKRHHKRRGRLANTESMDQIRSLGEDSPTNLHNCLSMSNIRAFSKVKSEMNKLYK